MIIIFMIIIFMMIIMITRSYATLRAEDLDSRARIQFGRVHFASCLRHSVRIRPDLLCHCHSSSVICHPLDWIVSPHYSLGWVHFEGKYNFCVDFFRGLNSGVLGDSFPIQGGAGCHVRRHISIIYRLA